MLPSYALLEPVFPFQKGIRLLGVTLSSLDGDPLRRAGQLKIVTLVERDRDPVVRNDLHL